VKRAPAIGRMTGQYMVCEIYQREGSRMALNRDISKINNYYIDDTDNQKYSTLIKYYKTNESKELYLQLLKRFKSRLSDDLYDGVIDSIAFGRLLRLDIERHERLRIDEWSDIEYEIVVYSPRHKQRCVCCSYRMTNIISETKDAIITAYDLGALSSESIEYPKRVHSVGSYKQCVWIHPAKTNCRYVDYRALAKLCDNDDYTYYHFKQQYEHSHYHKFKNVQFNITSTKNSMSTMDVSIADVVVSFITGLIKNSVQREGDTFYYRVDYADNLFLVWEKTSFLHEIPNPIDKTYSQLSLIGKGCLLILVGMACDAVVPKILMIQVLKAIIPRVGYFKIDKKIVWICVYEVVKHLLDKIYLYPFYLNVEFQIKGGKIPISTYMAAMTNRDTDVLHDFPEKFLFVSTFHAEYTSVNGDELTTCLYKDLSYIKFENAGSVYAAGGFFLNTDLVLSSDYVYKIGSLFFVINNARTSYDIVFSDGDLYAYNMQRVF